MGTLGYATKKRSSWWECKAWDGCWGNPDIYCEVSGQCLKPTSTRKKNNWNQDKTADFGIVDVRVDADFCGRQGWNGCGPPILPDVLTDIASDVTDFRYACNSHDVCYRNCETTRKDCEASFLSDMYAECAEEGSGLCTVLADLYYNAVYAFGEIFCKAGREVQGCGKNQMKACKL